MSIHKARLYWLKNRNNLIFYITTILTVATFVVVLMGISKTNSQSQRNEQILKSISCILLIQPQDRTEAKISECVQLNTGSPTLDRFIFKTITGQELPQHSTFMPKDLAQFFKGDKGDRGEAGDRGADGSDGKDSQSTHTIIREQLPPEKGDKGNDGEKGADGRELQLRHNDEKSRTEWRYIGDIGWQILVRDCELTNTCLP